MGIWSRKKQAEEAQRALELVHEVHMHLTDMIAGGDFGQAEMPLRRAVKELRAWAEAES